MAIPLTALVWEEPMDPSDVVDYEVDFSSLLSDEMIDTYSIVPLAESELLGLEVGTGEYAAYIGGNIIHLWLSVDPALQAAPAFSGEGTRLPLEISFVTDSTPPRKRQRTVVVKVMQR